ncbi:MAG: hypothetical protein ACO3IP_06030, partial [Burkholderiaceae bacterium]
MNHALSAPVFAPAMAELGPAFAAPVAPQPVQAPRWLTQNHALAEQVGVQAPGTENSTTFLPSK